MRSTFETTIEIIKKSWIKKKQTYCWRHSKNHVEIHIEWKNVESSSSSQVVSSTRFTCSHVKNSSTMCRSLSRLVTFHERLKNSRRRAFTLTSSFSCSTTFSLKTYSSFFELIWLRKHHRESQKISNDRAKTIANRRFFSSMIKIFLSA